MSARVAGMPLCGGGCSPGLKLPSEGFVADCGAVLSSLLQPVLFLCLAAPATVLASFDPIEQVNTLDGSVTPIGGS